MQSLKHCNHQADHRHRGSENRCAVQSKHDEFQWISQPQRSNLINVAVQDLGRSELSRRPRSPPLHFASWQRLSSNLHG